MIMEALQVLNLIKGIKELVDSSEQSLGPEHVEVMVKNIGLEDLANQVIDEDVTNTFKDLKSFLNS